MMEKLTIGEIETLLECIEYFGEYFNNYEVLDSAKNKLELMKLNQEQAENRIEFLEGVLRDIVMFRHRLNEPYEALLKAVLMAKKALDME
jgi:hypothetical protein